MPSSPVAGTPTALVTDHPDTQKLQQQLKEERMDKSLVRDQLEGVKKNFEERHTTLLDENLMIQEKLEKLQLRLDDKEKYVTDLRNQLAKERGSRSESLAKLTQSLKEAQLREQETRRQLEREQESSRTVRVELIELRHTAEQPGSVAGGMNGVIKSEAYQMLLQEKHALESDYRALRLGKEQAELARKKADDLVATVLQENTQLKTTMITERKGSETAPPTEKWSDRVVELTTLLENLKSEYGAKEREAESRQTRINQLSSELTMCKEELSLSQTRQKEKEKLLMRLTAEDSSIESSARATKKSLVLAMEELEQNKRQIDRLTHQLKEVTFNKDNVSKKLAAREEEARTKAIEHEQMSASINQLINKMAPNRP